LLAVADRVTAIERDPDLAAFLRREFAEAIDDGRLTVLEGDALEVPLPEFSVCISNLPYGVATEIAFRLLPLGKPAVLMFQREVGERMAAEPGTEAYGRLSVTTQHYAAVELVEPVPPAAFEPEPAVDSVLVRLEPRAPAYAVPEDALFLDLVTALFTQRRKTVRNAIRNTVHISGICDGDAVVEAVPEPLLAKRPDALTPAEFARIATIAADLEDG
jgi:16S rRNA (adenine1518-N6/adenine1519-N6)-dimethyltransferase